MASTGPPTTGVNVHPEGLEETVAETMIADGITDSVLVEVRTRLLANSH